MLKRLNFKEGFLLKECYNTSTVNTNQLSVTGVNSFKEQFYPQMIMTDNQNIGPEIKTENIKKEIAFELLKDQWKMGELIPEIGLVCVARREFFSCPAPPIIAETKGYSDSFSRIITENIRKENMSIRFPSEVIYALWSVLVGMRAIIKHPIQFDNAYVHIPTDFSTKETQCILVYTLMSTFLTEKVSNYTKGKVTCMDGIRFGDETQSKAVQALLEKYKDEPCLNSTVGEVIEDIRNDRVDAKALRKDLKERLSKLLDDIGYWDYVIVKPVELEKVKSEKLM